jgi:hypothetical protein
MLEEGMERLTLVHLIAFSFEELDSRLSILFHFWSFCQKIEDIGLVNPPFLKGLDPEVFPYKLCSFVAGYYT